MPLPIAVCVETLNSPGRVDRFMRCVALPGYESALGLSARGDLVWRDDARIAFELWVSADDQLMLLRRQGAGSVVVRRAGRSLALPFDKPVVLLDLDCVDIGEVRLRVHVHGQTDHVHAPVPFEERSSHPVATLATAVALGATAVGCRPSAEVPDAPAVVVDPGPAVSVAPPVASAALVEEPDATAVDAEEAPATSASSAVVRVPPPPMTAKPPIQVRERVPKPVRPSGGF